MKMLTCAAARRRLHAYHDAELPLSEQVAVAAHLEWCDPCAETLEELRALRDALRTALPGRQALTDLSEEDALNLQATVISRMKAEERVSLAAWMRDAFTDMHFIYAGISSVAAALICVAVTLGMMRFAPSDAPGSAAVLVRTLGTPGSDLNPVSVSPRLRLPRALDEPIWVTPAVVSPAADGHLTLSAVVTREGRVGNIEVLNENGGRWVATDPAEARAVENLIDAISRVRFEPASIEFEPTSRAGLPVAVNMVWLLTQTTVRAAASNDARDIRPPAARKRTA
jgi:hypothetical protein